MNKPTLFRIAGTTLALAGFLAVLLAAKLLAVATSNHEVASVISRALGFPG